MERKLGKGDLASRIGSFEGKKLDGRDKGSRIFLLGGRKGGLFQDFVPFFLISPRSFFFLYSARIGQVEQN